MHTALIVMGCSVFILLGIGHAALMLFTSKFEPRSAALLAQLKANSTGMTKTGNMWNGIKGFHLSHSLGMVIYGGFYIVLALENTHYLKSSTALNVGLLVVPAIYIVLAHRFWFSVPRDCFIVALCLLAASIIVA
ncbi:MAG: hypothetical protein IPO43_04205 [Rhodoferax sp.]|nr:hypothetical protein [Rhodoferax sp.]